MNIHQLTLTCFLAATMAGSLTAQVVQQPVLPTSVSTGYPAFTYQLDVDNLKEILANAPMVNDAVKGQGATLMLPSADGSTMVLEAEESPIMAPGLATKFPDIRTYRVKGEGVTGRVSVTEKGFHAILFTPSGTLYIDPLSAAVPGVYHTYNRNDYKAFYAYTKGHLCGVETSSEMDELLDIPANYQGRQTGDRLRKYDLALACTGEYSQFHGGTVNGALSAMVVTMNRVNGVYEREFSITMELVANNDDIIFLNANSDPYSNFSGGAMLAQNQNTIDAIIGSSNYDIGHVFSTGGGGIASLGSVCSGNNKARGVTGGNSPVGDPFDIDYVAHEMGHQFGANHTQNNNCNRNGSTAYEPGSASTIMGYAGICPPDLQNNSDDYFHAGSYNEVRAFSQNGFGNSCATITNTGNTAPVVTVDPKVYTIPRETPFVLRGSAIDNEGDNLTYCWEQMDLGPSGAPTNPFGNAPIFRSWEPVTIGERTFPRLLSVITGSLSIGETYPTYSRDMSFRLTARDNNLAGGGIGFDEVNMKVDGNKGPFTVTSPPANGSVQAGTYYLVEWDVANTDQAPINCQKVNILAYNGNGINFIDTIATEVPNSGSYYALMDIPTGGGFRVRVEAADNVFFNLNPGAFTAVNPTIPQGDTIELSVNADFSIGGMVVNWTDPFLNETQWILERSVGNNTGFSSLDTLPVNTTSYLDTAVSMLGTAYFYRVYAINPAGASAFSNEDSWLGVGINEEMGDQVEVYPIPAVNELIVQGSAFTDAIVYNSTGQQVLTAVLSSPRTKLDVSALPVGSYFIQFFERGVPAGTKSIQIVR